MDMAEEAGVALGAINSAIMAPFDAVAGAYAGISGGHLTVNHDTVLQVGKILHDHFLELDRVTRAKVRHLKVGVIGTDLVSDAATAEWAKILIVNPDSYSVRINQYIDGIGKLADQLKTAAQQYGFTEDEIKAAFGGK
jgi:hypothetical protein